MKEKFKTLSTRITPDVEQFLSEKFGTPSAGLAMSADIVKRVNDIGMDVNQISNEAENLMQIRRSSLREIRNYFTQGEWSYLADMLNGTMITPMFRCNIDALCFAIEEADALNNLGDKWKIDPIDLIEKVRKCCGSQIDAIYYRINQFWYSDNETRDMGEWSNW